MDRLDRQILSRLQQDGQISMARLSEEVGLSLSACHRRVKLLEAGRVISHYAARLNRQALGLEMQVFIEIKLASQRREDIEAFEAAIAAMPDILECHLISGEFDSLIRVAVRAPSDFEELYRNKLSQIPTVSQTKTLLSLSTVKEFKGYHLSDVTD